MTAPRLTMQREGALLWLTFEGGDGTPLTSDLVANLAAVLAGGADDGVHVALLCGANGRFPRGWEDPAPAEDAGRLTAALQAVAEAPLPVIALLEGGTYGGALALALVCDVRLAVEGVRLGFPVDHAAGLLPPGGSVARLARLAGRAQALHLLLTGESLESAGALRCGLVSAVFPGPAELRAEAGRLAAVIAGRGPIAVRYAKEVVTRGTEMPLEQALRYETDVTVILQSTADRAEGVRAFTEKRPPQFTGQ